MTEQTPNETGTAPSGTAPSGTAPSGTAPSGPSLPGAGTPAAEAAPAATPEGPPRREGRAGRKAARPEKVRPEKTRPEKTRPDRVRPEKPEKAARAEKARAEKAREKAERQAARAALRAQATEAGTAGGGTAAAETATEAARPVSESHVRLSYRLMLNRAATPEEVAAMMPQATSLADLRLAFLNSDEFERGYARMKAERDARRPPVLVHLHIPKTAGTTLAEAFAREPAMRPHAVIHDETLHELRTMPVQQRRALRYVRGHLNMGAGEALGLPYRYLTTIRRPGPRIHSFFRFIQRSRTHPAHEAVRDMGFGDYLDYSRTQVPHRIEIDNGQIRRLAGQLGDRTPGREQVYLRLALHHALHPATVFGYVEHFDALARRLVAEGYLSSPEIPARNVAPEEEGGYEAALAGLSEAQRALFDAYTVWDNYFYDLCLTLLPPE
jgi:hypothetical protein